METIELDLSDALILRSAAVGMSLDHNGDVFYVLVVTAGDRNGEEKELIFAVPPMHTDDFVRVVNGMSTKRE